MASSTINPEIPKFKLTGGNNDKTIFRALDDFSNIQAKEAQYIMKYITKLRTNAILVLSMNDWKKYIKAKTSKAHKNKRIYKKYRGVLLSTTFNKSAQIKVVKIEITTY